MSKLEFIGYTFDSDTITWNEFYTSYMGYRKLVPSYRLGQHFVNLFIKDRSSDLANKLWNLPEAGAMHVTLRTIEDLQWDLDKLLLVK